MAFGEPSLTAAGGLPELISMPTHTESSLNSNGLIISLIISIFRELLVRNLLKHEDGAFVVRLSESKKNCLVLSVKVPANHNASCISHYVIVRNEAGYRIKVSHSKLA